MGTQTYTSGSGNWTCPAGVTLVTVELWGGGGQGGCSSSTTYSAGGGGGGEYRKHVLAVSAGDYAYVCGAGGSTAAVGDNDGQDGANSTFNSTSVIAVGGKGGKKSSVRTGGLAGTGGTGTAANYDGGAGYTGVGTSNAKGGGGGGSGGTANTGNTATSQTAAAAVTNGGIGGTGGGNHLDGVAPVSGPGGGGGGAGHITGTTNTKGGAGYSGKCKLTWVDTSNIPVTTETLSFAEVVTVTPSAFVRLLLSDNIAASAATHTTAQLTAPAGKTSGADFQEGHISDDTNPITTDLDSGKYTELEWSIKTAAGLGTGDEIEFRITNTGADTLTLTVVPKITIGAGTPTISITETLSFAEALD